MTGAKTCLLFQSVFFLPGHALVTRIRGEKRRPSVALAMIWPLSGFKGGGKRQMSWVEGAGWTPEEGPHSCELS